MEKQRNYGLIIDKPKECDYIFGSSLVPMEIIQPSGQWDEFLPAEESQIFNGVDGKACVSFGSLSAIEILLRKLYNI